MTLHSRRALSLLLLMACSHPAKDGAPEVPQKTKAAKTAAAPTKAPTSETGSETEPKPKPKEALVLPETDDHLALGADFSCLARSGQVYCWGSNRFGQLGYETTKGILAWREQAKKIAGLSEVRQLSAGQFHVCALLSDGSIKCWGHGAYGQLGSGAEDSQSPLTVAFGTFKSVSAGARHSCAVKQDGSVWCWGDTSRGQLGFDAGYVPRAVPGLSDVIEIAAGSEHMCARKKDGTVWCWGDNRDAQLGSGNRSEPTGFSKTPSKLDIEGATKLRSGGGSSCAWTADGIFCWGRNDSRQLGMGSTGASAVLKKPKKLDSKQKFSDIAFGSRHAIALAEQRIFGSGLNHRGQLAQRTTKISRVFTESKGKDIASIASGAYHSCALASDKQVLCWGVNKRGQLGDGTRDPRKKPVRVTGLPSE